MRPELKKRLRQAGPFDWLAAILGSWMVPLSLIGNVRVTYLLSLLLWIVPILFLLPRFYAITDPGSRRRKALWATAIFILILGTILDVVFGHLILDFDKAVPSQYWFLVPGFGGIKIPIEEFLFYTLGGLAIVLFYIWTDEYWLYEYNVRHHRPLIPERGKLFDLSWPLLFTAVGLFIVGVVVKRLVGGPGPWIPIYYTFLVVFAFVPALWLYRAVRAVVNWRAFSFTTIYVLLTSLLWEVTLGIPKYWWRYQPNAMIGKNIDAWSTVAIFPIEALLVWIAVTFSCVLAYEALKFYFYDDRPRRERLFGPAPWEAPDASAPAGAKPPHA